ncbi:hypothetical protein FS837_011055 [Tulasnella sp. UAMH 9824]|nr:hypothetical protein FS837_011055 [Tulasnella sp. UAMH 9824]
MSFFGGATQPAAQPDVEVSDPPTDSISALSFCPTADYLAVASWDNNVRIYEISQTGQSQGKAMYSHEGPVLDVCWSKDGTKIFSGGADKAARMFDVSTGQSTQVGAHDAPIKCVRWIDMNGGILVTGSWDKTLKYWTPGNATPIASVALPERCYSLDVQGQLLVCATAERHIITINLNNPTNIYKKIDSPLKWQTRVVACFPAGDGYAVGSIEGRVAIQYVEDKDAVNNFSFKCHRKEGATTKDGTNVFAVNSITFHQQHGTFSTAGSDGVMYFWDKDSKTRLKTFDAAPGPISATAFNRTGTIFAYAISYDWSKGHSGMTAGHVNKVMLHALKDEEIKKKPKK